MAILRIDDWRTRPGLSLSIPAHIEIEDDHLASGTFGAIHAVRALDQKVPGKDLVAKLFSSEDEGGRKCLHALRRLFDRIDVDLGRNRSGSTFSDLEFCALPMGLFDATMNQGHVRGFVAQNVVSLGFELASRIECVRAQEESLRAQAVADALDLCASLARAVAALHRIGFIHADLNPQNIALEFSKRRVAILDFDGGAVVDGVDEFPVSGGKAPPWVSPEVFNARRKGLRYAGFENCMQAEIWCFALLLAWILFGEAPTLRENSDTGGHACDLPWLEPDFRYRPLAGEVERRVKERLEAVMLDTRGAAILQMLRRTLLPGGASFGSRPLLGEWLGILEPPSRKTALSQPLPVSASPASTPADNPVATQISPRPSRLILIAPILAFVFLVAGVANLKESSVPGPQTSPTRGQVDPRIPDLANGRYGGVVSWNGRAESLTIWIRGVLSTLPDGRGKLVEFDVLRAGRFQKGGRALFYREAGALLLDDGAIFSLTRGEEGQLQLRGIREAIGVLEWES